MMMSGTFKTKLDTMGEIPAEKGAPAMASGKFTATLSGGKKLKWKLTFTHLSGGATAAHIHMAAMGKSGLVIVPLCGHGTSPVSGTATVTEAQASSISAGTTYVNVHTAKKPRGRSGDRSPTRAA